MTSFGELFKGIGIGPNFFKGGFIGSIVVIIFGVVILFFCGFGLWWFFYKRKRWNLKVEFKLPRNIRSVVNRDGSIKVLGTLNKEWGKGFYDPNRGVVFVKRERKKAVPMKPFDVKRYLSDSGILSVIQIGIEDYRPVLDESYIEVVDDKTGEEAALIKAKIDTTEGKAWRNSYERERKNVYTIMNWIREHGNVIAIGLVVMMVLVGFGVLWTRIPKICG